MSDNDGVDDALRSATQTIAALLARNAQQIAMERERQARQQRAALDRANNRLAAEHAVNGVRGPQFTIQGAGPDAPRLQISQQEALDRVNWTEEDRHQFDGRTIRGSQVDIQSWIGQDRDVDAAIAERYPQLMTDAQLAYVRNDQLARDPNSYTVTVAGYDLTISKQTALEVVTQTQLPDDIDRASMRAWVGRDRDLDLAIFAQHPELMTPLQVQVHTDSEHRIARALDTIQAAAKTGSVTEQDLAAVRELVGVDPEIDQTINEHFPELLPAQTRRQQRSRQLYPAEPSLTVTHHTQDGLCERRFTTQQALDRIDDSAAMLAPGGYFEQQQHARGVVAQTERALFTTQRADEFRHWIGQHPEIDQRLHDTFPDLLNDRQIAQLQVLDGHHHYPDQPVLRMPSRDQEAPLQLTEPDAIGIIERRATTLRYLEPGQAREQLTNEIRDMIGQAPAVDQTIERHFPELLDPAARANMTLAEVPYPEPKTAEPLDAETINKMRNAEARALYPTAAAGADRQQVQALLDQLNKTDRMRVGDHQISGGAAALELRSRLRGYVGRDLETDQLIGQLRPDLLDVVQRSRMRAADDLLHADTEYGERARYETRGFDNHLDATTQHSIADQARRRADAELAAGDPAEAGWLEDFAETADDRADEYEIDADHDWDTAEQREYRARTYEACGHTQAAEARKLADTAQATPPWKAVLKRPTSRRTTRHANTSPGRQRKRGDRGR